MKIVEKSWNDFWAYRWRVEERHTYPGIFEWDQKIVSFIEDVCALSSGMKVLDLGCGGGDQAKVFAQRGYRIVGIDIAPPLIEFAKKQFAENGLQGLFEVGDMRSIMYSEEFDACVILSGTFGFFNDEENSRLLSLIHHALKPRGKLFMTYLSMDRIEKRKRTWSEVKEGWELTDVWFDHETCTRCTTTIIICKDGTIIKPKQESGYHANERIRCYTLPEMKRMMEGAGLELLASYNCRELDVPAKPIEPTTPHDTVVAQRGLT